jgi:hypothetical protein
MNEINLSIIIPLECDATKQRWPMLTMASATIVAYSNVGKKPPR